MSRATMHVSGFALVALALATPALAQQRGEPDEDVEAREAYFWAQRSYPFATRPYEAMLRARLAAASGTSALRSVAGSASSLAGGWRPLGPSGVFGADNGYFNSGPQLDAGRVTSIAPSPTGGPLVIGTASGGVWRSTFGLWSPLTDNECALTTGAVAVDPADETVIYAGTGEYNQNSSGCGLLRSINGGASWTALGASTFRFVNGGSAAFSRILVNRPSGGTENSTVLLAATNVALYRSASGGATWSNVLTGATAGLVAHPTRAGVVFAGNSDNGNSARRGLYRSTDGGTTWALLPPLPGVNVATIGRVELAASAAAPDLVYALIADRSTSKLLGLFVWDDATSAWTQPSAAGVYTGAGRGDFGRQGLYDLAVAVDPRDSKRVYVAGVRGFRSTDGGQTFTPMGMEIHVDWHTIVVDPRNPDILYAGTDGGVFVSTDAGDTWTSRNAGLAITQYYPGISMSPDGSKIMGGSQDNGTHTYTGSPLWNGFSGGDGGYTVINYSNPNVLYGEAQWSSVSGAYILRREGTQISFRVTGIVPQDRGAFIPPLLIDPTTPTKLYFATHRLYRTLDEGRNWIPISGDLTKGTGRIMTVAISKSDSLTIYAGTSDANVQVSRDGGVTFTNISAGLPTRTITRVVIDPDDATHVLVTVSGFGTGHVFESTTAGATWKDISGSGLVDAPVNSVVFVPGVGIMAGTDVGVYQTTDGGVTWRAGPAGLPNVIIQDLLYSPALRQVVVGTYGRGMFSYVIGVEAAVLRGDVNGDGKVDAFDALLIQQAIVGSLPTGTVAYPRGDANCNGTIDAGDVLLVLKASVGLPTTNSCVNTVK